MSDPVYIPLRLHSEYSITDGTVRLKALIKKALAEGLPALGISDLMNGFGLVKFYKACRGAGIKPVIGADVRIENPDRPDTPFRALLLVKNHNGYLRLSELLTRAFTCQEEGRLPQLKQAWLGEGGNEGLICLSGAHYGEVGLNLMNGHEAAAEAAAEKYAALFPNAFYLELQRLPEKPEWERSVAGSTALARKLNLPVVATHPTQFLEPDDFLAHEARVCIAEGWTLADRKRPREFSPSQYFVGAETMAERFADLPEALENTVEIAKRCNIHITLGKNFLPLFPTPDGLSLDDYLVKLSNEGLQERMVQLYPDEAERAAKMPEYQERLDFELNIIIQMKFPGYFLIVQDFINWAKTHGCPVGPGRGSGAGSLVAYSLKITDLDPLKYALLFERFLNPERVSMPDFDVDFCQANRGRVIEYVREKYGAEAVSQIVTFGTMSSKAVIRDVGRVLELPFTLCDKLSKLIPLEANKPLGLDDAMKAEPQIQELIEAEEADELITLAKKLEDLTRGLGMHAGGVLIAPSKISDFCGVYQADENASPVSMFDKGDVEEIGLVKFDFLGLRNLTIIEMAQNFIRQTTGEHVDVSHIPLDDQTAYKIFRDANTTAVFQFESSGMKKMLAQANTTNLEEIIAFVSLYRPGPMDLIPDFIERMKGAKFEYMHPLLEPVLEPTYGIMVYQEQVMLLSRQLANFTRGQSDTLRKAMGKKLIAQMDKLETLFYEGGMKNGHPKEVLNKIWEDWKKFASYAFNKSHATCYSWVAFQTAYFKAHYPAEYMAAVMSRNLANISEITKFMDECRTMGIKTLGPDVNESRLKFSVNKHGEIRFGLAAIKGMGDAAAQAIIQEREKNGLYTSVFDMVQRVNLSSVNKKAIESLALSGGFDSLGIARESYFGTDGKGATFIDNLTRYGQLFQMEQQQMQNSLFGASNAVEVSTPPVPQAERWSSIERLNKERDLVGIYLSAHPLDDYKIVLQSMCNTGCNELEDRMALVQKAEVTLAGMVTNTRSAVTKTGKPCGFVTIEDYSGSGELAFFGEEWGRWNGMFEVGRTLFVKCRFTQKYPTSAFVDLQVANIEYLQTTFDKRVERFTIQVDSAHVDQTVVNDIVTMVSDSPGQTQLYFEVYDSESNNTLLLKASIPPIRVGRTLVNYVESDPHMNYKVN
mgnify:CR=1 FL=1